MLRRNIVLPDDDADVLRTLAESAGVTESRIIRWAVRTFFELTLTESNQGYLALWRASKNVQEKNNGS